MMTAKEAEERYLKIRPEYIETAINTIDREMEFQPPECVVIDGKLFHHSFILDPEKKIV